MHCLTIVLLFYCSFFLPQNQILFLFVTAVQNERQPRNTATIRPETLRDMSAEQERALREAAVAVGVFG